MKYFAISLRQRIPTGENYRCLQSINALGHQEPFRKGHGKHLLLEDVSTVVPLCTAEGGGHSQFGGPTTGAAHQHETRFAVPLKKALRPPNDAVGAHQPTELPVRSCNGHELPADVIHPKEANSLPIALTHDDAHQIDIMECQRETLQNKMNGHTCPDGGRQSQEGNTLPAASGGVHVLEKKVLDHPDIQRFLQYQQRERLEVHDNLKGARSNNSARESRNLRNVVPSEWEHHPPLSSSSEVYQKLCLDQTLLEFGLFWSGGHDTSTNWSQRKVVDPSTTTATGSLRPEELPNNVGCCCQVLHCALEQSERNHTLVYLAMSTSGGTSPTIKRDGEGAHYDHCRKILREGVVEAVVFDTVLQCFLLDI